MPELPEVETLCRQLHQKICGRKISGSVIYDKKLSGIKNLGGKVVAGVERRGKTVTILLTDGQSVSIHLRMTGRLFWQQDSTGPKHSRWRMTFKDGNVFLVDPRRFATIKVQQSNPAKIPNDLITVFDEKAFWEKQAPRKVNIKHLLMDPQALAGIGNIYACEILYRSGISPLRQAATLSREEWKKIFINARRILKKGIKKRGTSISDWRDLYGKKGENQHELKAYGRERQRCLICGGSICRIKQGGRSTFYCPGCQK
ncbi:MAG TPA: bifunctional DNA-formamidopyrimidine glycosylase/DNA-(apurinic or apyrimidinic site) lyase [Smithella sp.]|nr:bifunctional DNA-formamidopyrimidine glycosylase/DNA-(apurinic or apyrimidinic site) lyase [Smithella sp.]HNY49964.1 bifunctional DNA-formamidopyrimidine glycosylase/DNA-(apurinic or apyrimidinic site) lyase [Smithella sp.]HOG90492.1 bifunctional DNA-formamidopyrimidine glycosylase/DNA-(apurinic or apyrimidinic site) lyase [Smithella sp.]HOU52193.1 bifunctional DNA-formamidopyrimidine glycosylase/DNA-(apurinic or apyrimidinic site) lyase [Smithella sp.]HQG66031.1 bifunctional DNA-formamidopy